MPLAISCRVSGRHRMSSLGTNCPPIAGIVGADWEYFSFPKHLNIKLEPSGPGQCECIILVSSDSHFPSVPVEQ